MSGNQKYQDPTVVDPSNGVVRGDRGAMPDRGTSSGFVGDGGSYGADTGANATNRMGSAHKEGDAMDRCMPKGDADMRFTSGGHSTSDPGTEFQADSDPQALDRSPHRTLHE